jgi:type VI secretion system protein VasI
MRNVFAAVFIMSTAVLAHAEEAPQACATLEDKDQRLNCFDKLFPKSSALPTEKASSDLVSTSDAGEWVISTDTSPLDDSKTVQATLLPKTAVGTGIGTPSPMLIVSCKEKVTTFVIYADMFMTQDEPEVTIRIGKEAPVIQKWRRSTNYKAVGLWRGQQAIPFLKSLESKDNESLFARVRATDRVDAEFNLSNVKAAIASVRDACNW